MRFFEDEKEMRNALIKWLRSNGFIVKESIYVKAFEVDVGALAYAEIARDGVVPSRTQNVFAFETKIATTFKLAKDVVEQAITRLLIADYVYVVVPHEAEVWKDEKSTEKIYPGKIVTKTASGTYSKSLGILTIDFRGNVNVLRGAKKSGLAINELRDMVVKELAKEKRSGLFIDDHT